MNDKRPICVVTSTIPATLRIFHQELIRQIDEKGYRVVAVSSPGRDLTEIAERTAADTTAIPMTRDISPFADLHALFAWLRLLRKLQPEVIITATGKASLLGLVAAAVLAVPTRIYYLGGLRLEVEIGIRRRILSLAERLTACLATDMVCNSRSLRRAYIRQGLVRPHTKLRVTVPGSSHGVDCSYYSPRHPDPSLMAHIGLRADIPVVGFVGRIREDKGIGVLATAIENLREAGVPCQLLLVGPRETRGGSALIARLKALPQTVCIGLVDDVRPYYSLMDVHVLPSFREGFPNVVLEASAMGIPTVTTDATGCVDSVINGVTGKIVPIADANALADALRALLGDAAKRRSMGLRARSVVQAQYRPMAVVASLLGDL